MATKSASLKAFNTHFDEFIEDLINVFPDNVDIKSAKNITKMTRQVNVTLIIKVSASGQGKFVGFDKGSTSRSQAYANAVSNYLGNIQFDAADNESNVTVQFVFDVN